MKDLQSPFRTVCVEDQGWVHFEFDYFQTGFVLYFVWW